MFLKLSRWISLFQDQCVASPELTGCVPEQPCKLPDLGPVPCMSGSQKHRFHRELLYLHMI